MAQTIVPVDEAANLPQIPVVAVCVPTFKRPQFLEKLLQSLTGLDRDQFSMHVLVVDNDADGSARPVVMRFAATLPNLLYEVEPERGIAAARNRLVALATSIGADYIAFVDDDEWVEPQWLARLVRTAMEYQVDGVAGAVLPEFDPEVPAWIAEGKFFGLPRHRTGERVHGYATANLLLKRAVLDGLDGPFDRTFDLTGGSDHHLFACLARRGARLVWCDEAVVHEHIPASRANSQWILKHAFRVGVTFSQSARKLEPAHRRVARAARALWELIRGAVTLPLLLIGEKAWNLHRLCYCASRLGRLSGIIGVTYDEYKHTHGR